LETIVLVNCIVEGSNLFDEVVEEVEICPTCGWVMCSESIVHWLPGCVFIGINFIQVRVRVKWELVEGRLSLFEEELPVEL
jgi:Na+/H+ antiporter NhaA